MKKIFPFIMIMAVVGLVLFVSGQDGPASHVFNKTIINFYELLFGQVSSAQNQSLTFWIRKTGHVVQYFGITLILFFALQKIKLSRLYAFTFSYIGAFLLACLDEWRQVALPQRTGTFQDVLIDGIGIVAAMVVLIVYFFITDGSAKKSE